jgi:hypothetical protein
MPWPGLSPIHHDKERRQKRRWPVLSAKDPPFDVLVSGGEPM